MKKFWAVALLSTAFISLPAFAANAVTLGSYTADLKELNNSGVTGTAQLTLLGKDGSDSPTSLRVNITATGLEPNMLHPQHIHGRFAGPGLGEGQPIDSVTPTPSDDTDGDGFIEVGEGQPAY